MASLKYSYQALDANGEVKNGEIDAPNSEAAFSLIHRSGLTPIEIRLMRTGWLEFLTRDMSFGPVLGSEAKVTFLRDLATFLNAGLPLDTALSLTRETCEKDRAENLIKSVQTRVREGASLAVALMAQEDTGITQAYIAQIALAEESGTLGDTLQRLADEEKRAQDFNTRLRSALTYPAILMIAVVAALLLVVLVVMPEFEPMFEGAGTKLPALTRAMMGFGAFLAKVWWLIPLFALAVPAISVWAKKSDVRRLQLDRWLLSRPFVVQMLIMPDFIRFARSLGSALEGGQALDAAMAGAIAGLKNHALKEKLNKALEAIRNGGRIAAQMSDPVYPVVLRQMTLVGEETGRLGIMLMKAGDHLAEKYETRLERFLALLGPILTLVSGAIVALLIGSVVMGMMSVNDFTQ